MNNATATPVGSEVTQLLLAWGQGDEAARDCVVPLVYGELKRLARYELRRERGGVQQQISLSAVENMALEESTDWLALDMARQDLAVMDARKSQIVELRFFGGLTIDETAEVLGLSTPTIEREWRAARAWLQTELISNA